MKENNKKNYSVGLQQRLKLVDGLALKSETKSNIENLLETFSKVHQIDLADKVLGLEKVKEEDREHYENKINEYIKNFLDPAKDKDAAAFIKNFPVMQCPKPLLREDMGADEEYLVKFRNYILNFPPGKLDKLVVINSGTADGATYLSQQKYFHNLIKEGVPVLIYPPVAAEVAVVEDGQEIEKPIISAEEIDPLTGERSREKPSLSPKLTGQGVESLGEYVTQLLSDRRELKGCEQEKIATVSKGSSRGAVSTTYMHNKLYLAFGDAIKHFILKDEEVNPFSRSYGVLYSSLPPNAICVALFATGGSGENSPIFSAVQDAKNNKGIDHNKTVFVAFPMKGDHCKFTKNGEQIHNKLFNLFLKFAQVPDNVFNADDKITEGVKNPLAKGTEIPDNLKLYLAKINSDPDRYKAKGYRRGAEYQALSTGDYAQEEILACRNQLFQELGELIPVLESKKNQPTMNVNMPDKTPEERKAILQALHDEGKKNNYTREEKIAIILIPFTLGFSGLVYKIQENKENIGFKEGALIALNIATLNLISTVSLLHKAVSHGISTLCKPANNSMTNTAKSTVLSGSATCAAEQITSLPQENNKKSQCSHSFTILGFAS